MYFKRFVFAIIFIVLSSLIFSQADNQDKEKILKSTNTVENAKQNKKEVKEEEKKEIKKEVSKPDDEFYSIQSKSLTACNGDVWFLQEYDDYGKITLSVLYEKDTLIERQEYFYEDNYKIALNIYSADKLVKIKYNKNGYEIEKSVYDKSGKVLQESVKNEYDKNNLLLKIALIKNDGSEYISVFTYNADRTKKTQTDFVDEEKICFIEYGQKKRIVHLFQFGKKIRVLEEEY